MTEETPTPGHDPDEIRALLTRLSRDKSAVSAHFGIRFDLEHLSSIETSRAKAAKTLFAHRDEV